MNDLENYVNSLFVNYKLTQEIKDLKEEIYGNLEAKKIDLMAQGMSESQAILQAKAGIIEIDSLISSNQKIYINQFKLERLQWCLIYLLAAWVITIPVSVFNTVGRMSILLFLLSACVGIYYIIFISMNKKLPQDETAFMNITRYEKLKKISWIVWAAFVLLCSLITTGMYFGSNIWFARPVNITGPYALGSLIVNYFLPMLTVLFPLIVSLNARLIGKYEVEKDEITK